jgi:hypothetical protein
VTPNVDERLASLIRSLGQVVLPHLPPEASLAQEQVHLALGHLQILRAQIDAAPAFEAEEAADAAAHARALADLGGPGAAALLAALAAGTTGHPRDRVTALHDAMDHYIAAAWTDGDTAHQAAVSALVLAYENVRVQKDRAWCAPFGFDRA